MLQSPLLPASAAYWRGAFQTPAGARFQVHDPATGAVLAELPELGAEATEAAVDAAASCLREVPGLEERKRRLLAIEALLLEHRGELARIVTAENGKPLAEAEGEVVYAAGFFRDAAAQVQHLAPREHPGRPRGLRWQVHHRPAGVAALITPWNFPVGMLAKKLAGALAAGCPVVVKPSELTPLSCVAFFTLLHGLGLPAGTVNLVFGRAPEIGRVLCDRPEVQVLSFTGSTAVGKLLAAQCAPGLKRVALELGGNAPFLVFDDADLDRAAEALMANKFRCAGQTCVCSNRILVQAGVHDAFVERVTRRVADLRVGPGSEVGVDIGPLIDRRGWDKVRGHVADALAKGARLELGGAAPAGREEGSFFQPTVLTGVGLDMACMSEETFGPLVAISRFDTEEEGLRLADDTPYGLAAYVFSRDPERLQRAAAWLHFGHVGLNTAAGPTPELPFGGMRDSGLGREGGLEGVMEFVELQTCPMAD